MKKLLFFVLLISSFGANATDYYVSQLTGSNSNSGLTPEEPFLTLQHAHDLTLPGDTVFVMNGIYTNGVPNSDVLTIDISGTDSAWITYKNYEGHSPVIQMAGNNWQGIRLQGADYIIIDGFKIIGNNDNITLEYAISEQNNLMNSSTSGNGIGVTFEFANPSNMSHHVVIKNCNISKCGGGGIFAYHTDYMTIENNVVSECAWFSPYNNSGISLYQNWNSDSSVEAKNFITRNTCYRNECYIPNTQNSTPIITDGNGIVVDDARNTQFGSTLGVYLGKTEISNNVVFDNGGRGIHCYSSDNIVVANNTSYKNCQSPSIQDSELTAYKSSNITFVNNISFPDGDVDPIQYYDSTNLIVEHNLWAANSGSADPIGTNYQVGDPSFVMESSNPLEADFRILGTSNARDNGTASFAPTLDKDGNERVDATDIGAFEYREILSNPSFNSNTFTAYPNPAKDIITIEIADIENTNTIATVFNSLGQQIKSSSFNGSNKLTISVDELSNGVYFISLSGSKSNALKFIKI